MSFFFLFQHSPVWFSPILMARLVDLITTNTPDRLFWFAVYGGIMLLMTGWNIPACVMRTKYASRMTRGVSRDLRIAICEQLQQLSLLYHDKHSIGRMQSKAIRDIDVVESLPNQFIWLLCSTTITIIIAITAIATRKPLALLFFVILVPLSIWLKMFFIKNLNQPSSNYRKSFENMSVGFSDMMVMMPVTRAHGLEEFELAKVKNKIADVFEKGFQFDMVTALFGASSWVSFRLFETIFLLGSVWFAFKGKITVGDTVMFYTFFGSISSSILALLNVLPAAAQASESAKSITELLHAPDREENRNKTPLQSITGKINMEDIHYSYPGTTEHAINGVTLEVIAGDSVAFVGPSGCGKSTLLSLILGFIRPLSGRILLDGEDMQKLDLRSYRAHVGVVSQDIVFFSGTLLENVQYGFKNISQKHIREVLEFANAWEFVEKLPDGINTRLGENGVKLSGGQKQRLAIARAVLRNPRILILDEATSALDVESETLVKEALDRIMEHRTSFVVAHRLSTVKGCDRIVVMEEGRVKCMGSHDELMKSDNFYSRIIK